jgi:hypothetical protein
LRDDKGYQPDEIYTQKLKSPAQIEKLVGKKNLIEDMIQKKSSGYNLVPATDPRPALAAGAQAVFALPSGE